MSTPQDVSIALAKFKAGTLEWPEVVKIATGVQYAPRVKGAPWFDIDDTNDESFGDIVVAMGLTPEQTAELKAVGIMP